jgi:serine/threonine protein kinase
MNPVNPEQASPEQIHPQENGSTHIPDPEEPAPPPGLGKGGVSNGGPGCLSEAEAARVAVVADEYLAALRRGEVVDRQVFLAAHPDLAPHLEPCLAGLGLIEAAVEQLEPGGRRGDAVSDEDAMPDVIGDYRIVRRLGRGGMGVVYEAEQLSLHRRVALKVLPVASVLSHMGLKRFRNESQAAAQLKHPHIVPVYSVGVDRGTHFYAMQLVEGRTLAEVVTALQSEQHPAPAPDEVLMQGNAPAAEALARTLTTGPAASGKGVSAYEPPPESSGSGRSRSSTSRPAFFQAVAQLGIQSAEALHHAHEQGIVHRDVKPSNLILDERGHLWVTDFGLALIRTGGEHLTLPGDLLGTARYMSPEQVQALALTVDHRTDVYSLGVTLYELLTLQPAFEAPTREQVLRQIVERDPQPPRRINPRIPRDVETIVLKAMAKAPEERYQTAAALAEDLQRFLADEPVLARRPTLVQRAEKWCRRHRPLVWAAGVVVVLTGVGMGLGSWLLWQEQQRTQAALRQSLANERQTEQERIRAERNLGLALDLLDETYDRVRELGEPRGYLDAGVLEPGLRFNERLAAENQGSPLALERMAHSLRLQYRIYWLTTVDRDQCLPLARQEVAVRRQLLALPGEDIDRRKRELADALLRMETGTAFGEAQALSRELLARHPDDPQVLSLDADIEHMWGNVYAGQGQYDRAVGHYRRSVQVRQLLPPAPHGPDQQGALAWTFEWLARALIESGRFPEAEQAARQAIASRDRGELHNVLAMALVRQGRYEEAQRELEALLPQYERWLATEPTRWPPAGLLAETASSLAAIHALHERWPQAATARERARQTYASFIAQWPKETGGYDGGLVCWATSTCDLADVLQMIPDRRHECEALYREVLAATEPLLERASPVGNLTHVRAWAHLRLGDWASAVEDLAAYSRRFPDDFHTRYRHAIACLGADDRDAYRAVCRDGVDHFSRATQGNGGARLAWASLLLPDSGIDATELAKHATPLLSEASFNANVLMARGMLLYRTGQYEELIRQWADGEETPGTAAGEIARALTAAHPWYLLAMAHQQLGHTDEARRWLARANEQAEQARSRGPLPWDQRVHLDLLREEAEQLIGG